MADSRPLSSNLETDWTKCCLCQIDKEEDLKSPPTRYETDRENDGYVMIARNIPLFHEIRQMPIKLDPKRLDHGDGIEETLRKNHAKYHQSCRISFSNSKLERARKRSATNTCDDSHNIPTKSRRRSLEEKVCFLCEKEAPKSEFRHAMTKDLDKRLNECARNLNDVRLMARLSGGDIIAQELKYHRSCLTALYNRERAHFASQSSQEALSTREQEAHPIVFSELLVYIVESRIGADGPMVFRLADLVSLYNQRLIQLGIEAPNVNSTRLKDKLLEEIPGLEAHKKGRDILLAFKEDVGEALSQVMDYSEALIVVKAAKILRKHMVEHKMPFKGSFHDNCIEDSLPSLLVQFVCMIEHGADIKSQLRFGASKTDLAMAQLLQYNCYARYREGAKTVRHSKDRETPFPVFIGMSTYSKTRKRVLVEMLHDHGISISYDRVLEISAQLGDAAVSQFNMEGVVCPSILRKDIFTTAAMDNIDHNPSATSASTSFHGTSISIFQHPTSDNKGVVREKLPVNTKAKKVPELPDSFTNIHPAFFTDKQPKPSRIDSPISVPTLQLQPEYEWLQKVSLVESVNEHEVNVTWSSHHASESRSPPFEVSITSLLPLLRDQAHSVATIKHVMDKVSDIVSVLNPGQVPVIAADQPIYATAKQIQWHWPEHYGEDKFIIMFGGLHIEMAAFKSIGSLLQESGWTGALVESGVTTPGTAESFLSASSVTRTRQIHQVTSCCLYKLLNEAYENYTTEGNESRLSKEDWVKKREAEIPQFQFWNLILRMELAIFSLIRSFREADFLLYRQSLQELIPYFFANNNVNYARWLPIHLKDMICLEEMQPRIAAEFRSGKFVVHKSSRAFSALAIDQAHEQSNAVIKGDGGAIGITEDPSALRRWMVAGPEVSFLVGQYETLCGAKDTNEEVQHHEQNEHAQKTFIERVQKLHSVMKEMGNPFMEETGELLTLDTKSVAHASAAALVAEHYKRGKARFDEFLKGLEEEQDCTFYRPIKRNNIDFFRQQPELSSKELKQRNTKDESQLFSKLFISCQSRECDLNDFFKHENLSSPASLSENGKLYPSQKSDLTHILEDKVTLPEEKPDAEVIIIDGSALVSSIHPKISKTFEEYATQEFVPKVQSYCSIYSRLDLVFDVYTSNSLKAETRKKRGFGARRRVSEKGSIPKNWTNFMRDNTNKTELFNFLATKVIELCTVNVVYVTTEDSVVSNRPVNLEGLSKCNHEEADTRLFVHARHAAAEGRKSIIIKANDTDVLVISVSVLPDLINIGLQTLCIEFGQGNSLRWIPVNAIHKEIGAVKSEGLLFFHAFTGCDVVSAFRGKGKKTAWQTWDVCPDVTEVFRKLSKYPPVISEHDQNVLEMFVIMMYDRSSATASIDDARLDLFARKQKPYESIPPTRGALIEHTKRAVYQAGCIWSQAAICNMENESPGDWGWKKNGDMWTTVWSKLPPIAESCQQLTKCGCKTECHGRCKCFRLTLPCTALCSCNCDH